MSRPVSAAREVERKIPRAKPARRAPDGDVSERRPVWARNFNFIIIGRDHLAGVLAMNRLAKIFCLPCVLFSLACGTLVFAQNPPVPSGAGNRAPGSQFRALRSVSGSNGHEANGRFVMDDPRSVFVVGKDAKVIVYFEWEGPLGPHHFEGLWRSPEDKIVLISDFRYEAKGKQYSGYWSMLLSDATPPGEWKLEARIDGEFAGTHSFVITSSGTPPPAVPPARQPLATSALYKQALDATVFIEKLAADGSLLARSSGFWIGSDIVLTAFEAIDGAASLRIVSPNGMRATTDQVVAWSRWQDWALLNVPRASGPSLKRAAPNSVNVGDHCVFLETGPSGSRLTDGTITGKNSFPRAGDRFLVASGATATSIGGPLLDEFGDYVGVIGGTVLPGASALKMLDLLAEHRPAPGGSMIVENGAMAVPISQIPENPASPAKTALAELNQRGEFLSPVTKSDLVGFAQLAVVTGKGSDRSKMPREYRWVFSRREGHAMVFIHWQPARKVKGKAMLRVFDADNHKLAESKPDTLNLAPGGFLQSAWDVPVERLAPAIYRVDILFDDQTVWRDFFRVTD